MRYLIVVFSLIVSFNSFEQISFYKLFTDNGYDFGQGVVQLEDSSYVLTGSSSSFYTESSQVFLLKIDSLGNKIWSTNYGGTGSDWGRRVLYKKNVGFFIAGYTNSIGEGGFDYYLIKTDESGNFEWEKSYGSYGWEKVHDAALTRDTGVVMVGETSSNLSDNQDVYIVRTNQIGDTLWTKTMGGNSDDFATSIEPYRDSLFLISGTKYIEDSLVNKAFLLMIHEDGTVLWEDTIGLNGNYDISDFVIENDEIQAVGSNSGVDGTSNMVTIEYDLLAQNFTDEIVHVNSGDHRGRLITKYGVPGQRYIAYTFKDEVSYNIGEDLHMGNFASVNIWYINGVSEITHLGQDEPGHLIETSDGGAFMVGYTSSGGLGGANIFLLKIGPNQLYPTIDEFPSFDNYVSIEEVFEHLDFNAYPNPANEDIQLDFVSTNRIELSLIDLNGNEVFRNEINSSSKIDLTQIQSGVYFINVYEDNSIVGRKKIVIQH